MSSAGFFFSCGKIPESGYLAECVRACIVLLGLLWNSGFWVTKDFSRELGFLLHCRLSLSLALRALPYIRSQRKRRNISTKTEMYVKAQTMPAHVACAEIPSVHLILLLYSQRNGYDDDYSVMSSRVSNCVSHSL